MVKENITSSGEVEMDDIDSSVTRPDGRFHYIFDASKGMHELDWNEI